MVFDTYESVRLKCQVGGNYSFPIKRILDNLSAHCQAIQGFGRDFDLLRKFMVAES